MPYVRLTSKCKQGIDLGKERIFVIHFETEEQYQRSASSMFLHDIERIVETELKDWEDIDHAIEIMKDPETGKLPQPISKFPKLPTGFRVV
jgi:hypothetical protein